MKVQNVPLGEKEYLNPQEAILHWNFSHRKFHAFLKKGNYSFVAYYGTRRLILREAFEKYLKTHPGVKEALTVGESKYKGHN